MRKRIAILAFVLILGTWAYAFWSYHRDSWKPRMDDLLIVNASGNRPVVMLKLMFYDYDHMANPWQWSFVTEFLLENHYSENLSIEVKIVVESPDPHGAGSPCDILVPSGGSQSVRLGTGFETVAKDTLPRGTYRILARTELERKRGNEVKTYTFEWELASGLINQTSQIVIPDKVPGEPT